jgi:hypothetical protein
MPKATIVEGTNSTIEIKEEMPMPCRNKQFQPLSNSEDSYEKSINDEQEKKRRKRYKE